MHVADLMQRDVLTLDPTDTLRLADDVMRLGRIRHFPIVTRDGRLVGVLSQRDLYRAAMSSLLDMPPAAEREWLGTIDVQAVMTPHVVTITPEAPARQAVEVMLERRIGCLPVIDGAGALVGLLSESDCLRYLDHVLRIADTRAALPELESGS
jgi:CBS domain-containing protein